MYESYVVPCLRDATPDEKTKDVHDDVRTIRVRTQEVVRNVHTIVSHRKNERLQVT